MPNQTFRDFLHQLAESAHSPAEKGATFERLVKAFLEVDKIQAARFDKVWLWPDWPGNRNRHDTGIDLVARERDSRNLVAIQCKFYAEATPIALEQLNKFLTAYGETQFASGILVATSDRWTRNAESTIREARTKPVERWGPDAFEHSSIDWSVFDLNNPHGVIRRPPKNLYPYQQKALDDVIAGLAHRDRGKLIMACGSGKTLTALRIAERIAAPGGNVLFLTPSISLLSQSLINWANDANLPLKTFAVCSDTKAGRRDEDADDISPYDLAFPASTDVNKLMEHLNRTDRAGSITVIFSTYQSLDVISQAQQAGLPRFDLIICDEAHRTTGVSLQGKSESSFQRIHDDNFIAAQKRLYMTATPRIYGDRAKRKANENLLTLASMDHESLYGPEFHRLGFGQAAELGILSPYKVVILNVDQEQVGIDLDHILSKSSNPVNMDNGARMVGCWNGLGKRGASGFDFTADPQPAKRAVAFSSRISQSKFFKKHFPDVIRACIEAAGPDAGNLLNCKVKHVDSRQNALKRAKRLAWLSDEPDAGVCKILSNARCLTEGIDVPALDAVLFLHPRKSEIDVVQAVGRVMRQSPGKQFGYIILPIAQAPNATPQETVSSSSYKAVWQVINAISAHDDRFEALINQLALTKPGDNAPTDFPDDATIGANGNDHDDIESGDTPEPEGIQARLMIQGTPELRDAILAKIVEKYADPGYWEKWASNIREIAQRHEARIRALLNNPQSGVRPIFDQFLAGLRRNLNDGIAEPDAIGMLSQHLISKPVFDALFADYAFAAQNPVSRAMQSTLETLQERGLEKETEGLESFYRDVRICVQGITDAAGKQKIIAQLYQRFFKLALPETAARLGIVYTPVEVVDYILHSVEDLLIREFNASLSDPGVHILDPFVGTGTFLTRLLRSGLIRPHDLQRKYESELHANDIMLLAYYVAAVNIESTYHDLAQTRQYLPFNGIVLTDTFQSYEPNAPMDEYLFLSNNKRIKRQKKQDIRVIIGNPPWSIGQQSENDDNKNRVYDSLRKRISDTYAKKSNATLQRSLYDAYIQSIRWASDLVDGSPNGGIVAFVTNGGFISSGSADGLRKTLATEFHYIYCYNLRGDQRTAGEKSLQEAGKIFGAGSRAGVAILLLVKKPGKSPGAEIYYRDIGDYLSRDAKLKILSDSTSLIPMWQTITPNENGDWINQRTEGFQDLFPLYGKGGIFTLHSPGILTSRDAWCYNFSNDKVSQNTKAMIEFFNSQGKTNNPDRNPTKFSWSRKTLRLARNGTHLHHDTKRVYISQHRPFCKQRAYFQRNANEEVYRQAQIYPMADVANLGIAVSEKNRTQPLSCLMTDVLPNYSTLGATSQYLPRWTYRERNLLSKDPAEHYDKVSNISAVALDKFRRHYADDTISEDDLFYYAYGVLHHQGYREKYGNDLSKQTARIPLAVNRDDFRKFVLAGRDLAELHLNYETAELYPLTETYAPNANPNTPDFYQVSKMRFGKQNDTENRTVIVYNSNITLSGIPAQAHEYRLGQYSALRWLLERYRVKTNKDSGITNDPNDWAAEHGQPRYIVDLVKRVTTVSVRTVEIVRNLPYMRFDAAALPPDVSRFRQLADQWEKDTIYQSNSRQMASHPAYQEIIAMGSAVVPLILERLEQQGGRWFSALRTITAADPVSPKDRGNAPAMTAAWLEWGQRNAYA